MLSTPPLLNLDSNEPGATAGTSKPRRSRRIGIVLFDACDLLSVSLIAEAFEIATCLASSGLIEWTYQISILSDKGGNIAGAPSLRVCTESFNAHKESEFDALFVTAGHTVADGVGATPSIPWTSRVNAKAADVRLVDAALPWLDAKGSPGRRSTEASACASAECNEQRAKPQGANDALTGALKLIREDLGDGIARRVAQRLSVCTQSTMEAILDDIAGSTPADKVRKAAHWLDENCRHPVTVEGAAHFAAMSERSLLRHFRSELGMTPSDYLMNARLKIVCDLLAETDLSVDKVARRAGMTGGDHLARHFRRHMKVSPTEYRAQRRCRGVEESGDVTFVPHAECPIDIVSAGAALDARPDASLL